MKSRTKIRVLWLAAAAALLVACKSDGTARTAGSAEHQHGATAKAAKPESEKTLYHCPMHPTYTSEKPGDCPICGMKLVAMEPQGKPVRAEEPAPAGKKVMYRSTMSPNEVSDKPGKDSMGMDMVPFEVEESAAVTEVAGRIQVKISPERQQLIGVKTAPVKSQPLHKIVKAAGRVDYAEPSLSFVSLKFDGWVEKLYVNSTGRAVRKGEPLFEIYSPDLVSAQQEYLIAFKAGATIGDTSSLLKAAREKLRLWGVTDNQVEDLERTGQSSKSLAIHAPGSGIVIEKNVLQGQKILAGENLYKIADLSRVWILGEIYDHELPFVKMGQQAKISLSYYPGESFDGRLMYISPYLKPETRTIQVRIEVANPGLKLKPEMFATIDIHVDYGNKLTVPFDAVFDAGETKLVFVAKGDGTFEPRTVTLGVKGQDMFEVLGGLKGGENVVTSANFLIDSESSLKAALNRMTATPTGERRND